MHVRVHARIHARAARVHTTVRARVHARAAQVRVKALSLVFTNILLRSKEWMSIKNFIIKCITWVRATESARKYA